MISHSRKQVNRYTISVGLNDKDENTQKFQTERIMGLVTSCCKGHDLAFSCYHQRGGYKPENGGYILENSIAIVLNDPDETMVEELCQDLCAFLNQETVMVTAQKAECYYVSCSIKES